MEPESSSTDTSGKVARGVLLAGGLAAVLVSTCCLGPLVLISLGVSGAWIGNLTTLEPYRPALIVAAVVALAVVWWRVWRPVAACESGLICAFLDVNHSDKTLFWIVLALVVVAIGVPLVAPWFY